MLKYFKQVDVGKNDVKKSDDVIAFVMSMLTVFEFSLSKRIRIEIFVNRFLVFCLECCSNFILCVLLEARMVYLRSCKIPTANNRPSEEKSQAIRCRIFFVLQKSTA